MTLPISSWRLGLHTFSAYCERALDLPGYIPFLGSYSSFFRTKLAMGQTIGALVTGLFFLIGQAHHHFYGSSTFFSATLIEELKITSIELIKSATGNFIRALIESIAFVNLLLFSFDQQKSRSNPLIFQTLPPILDPRLHRPILFWSYLPSDLTQPN